VAILDDKIKAAEKMMRQAYDALIEYVERPKKPSSYEDASPAGRFARTRLRG